MKEARKGGRESRKDRRNKGRKKERGREGEKRMKGKRKERKMEKKKRTMRSYRNVFFPFSRMWSLHVCIL